jgi:hypothetical protein
MLTSVIIIAILFSVEARNQFKELVNTVAVIRNEEVNVHFVLVKLYFVLDIRYGFLFIICSMKHYTIVLIFRVRNI